MGQRTFNEVSAAAAKRVAERLSKTPGGFLVTYEEVVQALRDEQIYRPASRVDKLLTALDNEKMTGTFYVVALACAKEARYRNEERRDLIYGLRPFVTALIEEHKEIEEAD